MATTTRKKTAEQPSDNKDALLRFTYEGDEYELDLEALTVAETRLAKKRFGVTYRQILMGIAQADGDAIAAIIYLATNRAGKPVKSDQLDSLQPLQFLEHNLIEDEDAEPLSRDDIQDMAEALDGEADPTQ